MGHFDATKGKQALEIRSSLSERRALTDPILPGNSAELAHTHSRQWAKAHGELRTQNVRLSTLVVGFHRVVSLFLCSPKRSNAESHVETPRNKRVSLAQTLTSCVTHQGGESPSLTSADCLVIAKQDAKTKNNFSAVFLRCDQVYYVSQRLKELIQLGKFPLVCFSLYPKYYLLTLTNIFKCSNFQVKKHFNCFFFCNLWS